MKYWLVMKGSNSHVAIVFNEDTKEWWELWEGIAEDFGRDEFIEAFDHYGDWEKYLVKEEFSLKDMYPKCYVVEYDDYYSLFDDFVHYLKVFWYATKQD